MRHGTSDPHYVCDHCDATPSSRRYKLESDCPACDYGLLQVCEECAEEDDDVPDYDDVDDDE